MKNFSKAEFREFRNPDGETRATDPVDGIGQPPHFPHFSPYKGEMRGNEGVHRATDPVGYWICGPGSGSGYVEPAA